MLLKFYNNKQFSKEKNKLLIEIMCCTFRYMKPLVGPNYVCYYKLSSLVHPLTSSEMETSYARIADDHNCDTFYFAFVQAASHVVGFFKNLFRL